MIWKKKHISSQAKTSGEYIREYITTQGLTSENHRQAYKTAIVGGGPKGMYALERLLCRGTRHINKPLPDVIVYWFNSDENFGCGPNYNPSQPDYLLINYCIGNIDSWNRKNPNPHIKAPLNFVKWLELHKSVKNTVRPTDYATRALVGCYLQYVTEQLIRTKPDNIQLVLLTGKVTGIKYSTYFKLEHQQSTIYADNVLLATGHIYCNDILFRRSPEKKPLSNIYISKVYPIEKSNIISDRRSVGIAGMGLTFIDVALHLTEGRGGTFMKDYTYIESGKEPILYPFSRNNIPILPRGPVPDLPSYRLRYMNNDWLCNMKEIRQKRKICFWKEIYPLLQKEVQFAYYSTLLQNEGEKEIEQYIRQTDKNYRFSLENLLYPQWQTTENLHTLIINYMESMIGEAEKGETNSPVMAAAAVWRQVMPFVGELYKNGGLTGESHEKFDRELASALCRTSFGPPIENMKKILALAKAGIIRFIFNGKVSVKYMETDEKFILQNNTVKLTADFLIDARIGKPALKKNNAPLYNNLYRNKILRPFENEHYQPGCPAMDKNGQVILPGKKIPLFFYGINTEGILLDNDSLSKKRNDFGTPWAHYVMQEIRQRQHARTEISFVKK